MESKKSIVILTGSGISAESGIQTFRASDGTWHNHRVEDVASPEGFKRRPKLVHEFYNARRAQLLSGDVAPNPAHDALARLEQEYDGDVVLITQNVDDLHERAGSRSVVHIHGELLKIRCTHCETVCVTTEPTTVESICTECSAVGSLRPDIVWFGEIPFHMEAIEQALRNADLFVSIGTSGVVYPAAGFYQMASAVGADTLEINLEATGSPFDDVLVGPASVVVPEWVSSVLQN